jgi:hypothetical protein
MSTNKLANSLADLLVCRLVIPQGIIDLKTITTHQGKNVILYLDLIFFTKMQLTSSSFLFGITFSQSLLND